MSHSSSPPSSSPPSTSTPHPRHTTLLIGLSGPSSSGKTTLARLLRQIFNLEVDVLSSLAGLGPGTERRRATVKLFILHEDDFYKTDAEIPRKRFMSPEHGVRTFDDWDCVESLDLPPLRSALVHIRRHGRLPDSLVSKEDQNAVGESGVSDADVQRFRREVQEWLAGGGGGDGDGDVGVDANAADPQTTTTTTICLLDGFLLYPSPGSREGTLKRELVDMMRETLDAKLFIPSTREQTIERRTKRTGYVTLEGFWEDPEGYVEDVVWTNFARDHGWLFGGKMDGSEDEDDEGGYEGMSLDVRNAVDEGRVDRDVASAHGISVGLGTGYLHLRDILPWAVDRVKDTIEASSVYGPRVE